MTRIARVSRSGVPGDDLDQAIDAAEGARALVITGTGDRAFVSGGDLRELAAIRTLDGATEYVGGSFISSPGPADDIEEAERWREVFPQLAARVRVPVHVGLGDQELWWQAGPTALAGIAG
ncbi:MAG: hypothetical protein ABIS86_22415, partial [Streptosporangiaceae bacterium]